MRLLVKAAPPPSFSGWLASGNEDWQPAWEALSGPVKRAAKASLRAEQGDCCAYCGGRLIRGITPGEPDSLNEVEHIEHLVPRAAARERALDWSNLVLSCGGETGDPPPGHKHCGHAKGDWHDPEAFVGPTRPGCEEAFHYLANGAVEPGDAPVGQAAEAPAETLRRLNLDCDRLRRRREAALQGLLGESFEELGTLTRSELVTLARAQDERDRDGRLPEFGMVIRQVLEGLV